MSKRCCRLGHKNSACSGLHIVSLVLFVMFVCRVCCRFWRTNVSISTWSDNAFPRLPLLFVEAHLAKGCYLECRSRLDSCHTQTTCGFYIHEKLNWPQAQSANQLRYSMLEFIRNSRFCAVNIISERELTFTFANCCRPSGLCTLLRRLQFSAIFLWHLVPWPSIDMHIKCYGGRLRGTSPPGE